MRPPSKLLRISSLVLVLFVLVGYGVYRITSSPSAILKHALKIPVIPQSVADLRMGSDVWTDEVRCFYLTIRPEEFPHLVAGRHFQGVTNEFQRETRTIHVSPPGTVLGHSSYEWQTNGARCMICPDDSHEHVIIIFSAD